MTVVSFRYIDPAGGEHAFYPRLHPQVPATVDGVNCGTAGGTHCDTLYAQDGTYLRMQRHLPEAGVCHLDEQQCRTIEFPDGEIHEFSDVNVTGVNDWRVTRIRDRFGNFVDFDYSVTQVDVTDSHNRSHTLHVTDGRVESVDFSGITGTWDLQYSVDAAIERQRWSGQDCNDPEEEPEQFLDVDLLTDLVLPDGSLYSMAYFTDDGISVLSGGLEKLRVPTGGRTE